MRFIVVFLILSVFGFGETNQTITNTEIEKINKLIEKNYSLRQEFLEISKNLTNSQYIKMEKYHQNKINKILIKKTLLEQDKIDLSMEYKFLGILHIGQKDYKNAVKIHKKSINNLEDINDSMLVAFTVSELASIYYQQKAYNEAEFFYQKSINIYKKLNDIFFNDYLIYDMYFLGVIYIKQEQYDKAENLYYEVLNVINENNISDYRGKVYLHLADISYGKGDYLEASKKINKAMQYYETQEETKSSQWMLMEAGYRLIYTCINHNVSTCSEKLCLKYIMLAKTFLDERNELAENIQIALYVLADIYERANRTEKAEQVYKELNEIISRYPQYKVLNPFYYLGLSKINFQRNQFDKSIENYINYMIGYTQYDPFLSLLISLVVLIVIYFMFRSILNHSNTYRAFLVTNTHYKDLLKNKKLFTLFKLFDSFLQKYSISNNKYNQAIKFAKSNVEIRIHILANLLNSSNYKNEEEFYRISLPEHFPINLSSLLVYFTKDKLDEVKEKLQNITDTVLVINDNREEQDKINEYANDKINRIIAPRSHEVTEILLKPDSIDTFAKIISQQLNTKAISPYKPSGDVKNANMFFGRVGIISDIINRNLSNYIIVGARQLGKSSLLQELHRRYKEKSIPSHYITLDSNSDLLYHLSKALQVDVNLEAVQEAIYSSPKPIVFLIDEVDEFFKHYKEDIDTFTSLFRSLAQGDKAYFILAGFWEIYQETLKPKSPLKNFGGETIKLEGLEIEACREMITNPMEILGIAYESDEVIEEIIEASGTRPNLIAYICHKLIAVIDAKVITQEHLDKVLSGSFGDLIGLGHIGSKLDRAIIFATIERESFYIDDLYTIFEEYDYLVDSIELESSIKRLELSFILSQKSGAYYYQVPLFVEKIKENYQDLKRHLQKTIQEIKTFK